MNEESYRTEQNPLTGRILELHRAIEKGELLEYLRNLSIGQVSLDIYMLRDNIEEKITEGIKTKPYYLVLSEVDIELDALCKTKLEQGKKIH